MCFQHVTAVTGPGSGLTENSSVFHAGKNNLPLSCLLSTPESACDRKHSAINSSLYLQSISHVHNRREERGESSGERFFRNACADPDDDESEEEAAA